MARVRYIMDSAKVPGYGLAVNPGILLMSILVAVIPLELHAEEEFGAALEKAREAALDHRYTEVIELLTPFNAIDDPETRYITAAEIGRAFFHLGRYHEAHRAFREAVQLRPERPETAIYLEATSYLLGEKEQAYAILREILKSGARDLYLALTLPGERQFASDPEVHSILNEYTVPLDLDVDRTRMLGVSLGDRRELAVKNLEARSSSPEAPVLTAHAGPALIWAFVFDTEQQLEEILLQTENLLRYTPYRLRFDDGLGWETTPAAAIAAWGPPDDTTTSVDEGITMIWNRPGSLLILDFGRPRRPRPPGISEGVAMLRTVQLKRQKSDSAARMRE